MDIQRGERGAPAAAGNGRVVVSGKTFLRQEAFLEQRGLSRQARTLSVNGAGERGVAEAPPALYLQGTRERAALLEEAPPSPAVTWQPLGPEGIPDGQTYGSGPGGSATMAGRVTAIAVDPRDSDHLLVGSAAGGVWE